MDHPPRGRSRFIARSTIDVPASELAAWHLRPGAFDRLNPPWERVSVVGGSPAIGEGTRVVLELALGPLRRRWVALHRGFENGRGFQDVQESGPFASWVHTHRFLEQSERSCVLEDRIDYALPLGRLGRLLGDGLVQRKLARMFAYRHAVTRGDLERWRDARLTRPLKVALSGSSGLVGSALASFLRAGGHEVLSLVRREPAASGEIYYDPRRQELDAARLEGLDGVIHLAGAGIADRRWTAERKRQIVESRVSGTGLIAGALARLASPPPVLVNASAIGFYGDRGDEIVDETSPAGTGFLSRTSQEWECAVSPADAAGIRVVRLRIGIVLAARGGALARMLPPFRLGLGGRVGSGRQFMSWIGLDDLIGVILHALVTPDLRGAVNAVAPGAVPNAVFAATLARVLRRPSALPLPGAAIGLLLGEMGRELLLGGARVFPGRLERSGFRFRHPGLEEALRFELGRPAV